MQLHCGNLGLVGSGLPASATEGIFGQQQNLFFCPATTAGGEVGPLGGPQDDGGSLQHGRLDGHGVPSCCLPSSLWAACLSFTGWTDCISKSCHTGLSGSLLLTLIHGLKPLDVPSQEFNHGLVLSAAPLLDNQMVEVRTLC